MICDKPRLSINCITYNQKNFIRQTLDSFLMQKTNFPFVVYISDDASTDGTAEIIQEYADKYPDIIKPRLRTENVGGPKNYLENLMRADCEYFANCEGDDYWTDPYKLQKQVDFLDAHPDFSICFHLVREKWEDGSGRKDALLPPPHVRYEKSVLTLDDFFKHNFICGANTVVYRWRFNRTDTRVEDYFPLNIEPGDWFLHLLHAEVGKIYFMNEEMSVYRRHKGGIFYHQYESDDFYIKNGLKHIKFYKEVEKRFHYDNSKPVFDIGIELYKSLIRNDRFDMLQTFKSEYAKDYERIKNSMFERSSLFDEKTYKKILRKASLAYKVERTFSFGKHRKKINLILKRIKSVM